MAVPLLKLIHTYSQLLHIYYKLGAWFCLSEEMLKAAKEQQALDDEVMPNGGRSRGLFRKSRKFSQQVLMTRGTVSLYRLFPSALFLSYLKQMLRQWMSAIFEICVKSRYLSSSPPHTHISTEITSI